jgi:hypothetical protein
MQKLALVGSGSGTRDLAPWDDLSFDVWVLNEAANLSWCKRWDADFQLHDEDIYTRLDNPKDETNWAWLQQSHGKPIYMQRVDSRVPDSEEYPLQDAIDLIGHKYLEATVCMALALAYLKGYEEIHIWGFEMSTSEYKTQAECFRFWIGFLMGRLGTDKVVLHCAQHLFEGPLYGYEGNYKFEPEYFADRMALLDTDWQNTDKILKFAQKNVERILMAHEYDKAMDCITAYQNAALLCGQNAGALSEADRYSKATIVDRTLLEHQIVQTAQDGDKLQEKMHMTAGKVELFVNLWIRTHDDRALKDIVDNVIIYGDLAYRVGVNHGAYVENMIYVQHLDQMIVANGGYIGPSPVQLPKMTMAVNA